MKKCPFCGEEIKVEAVKCRFCREFLKAQGQPENKQTPLPGASPKSFEPDDSTKGIPPLQVNAAINQRKTWTKWILRGLCAFIVFDLIVGGFIECSNIKLISEIISIDGGEAALTQRGIEHGGIPSGGNLPLWEVVTWTVVRQVVDWIPRRMELVLSGHPSGFSSIYLVNQEKKVLNEMRDPVKKEAEDEKLRQKQRQEKQRELEDKRLRDFDRKIQKSIENDFQAAVNILNSQNAARYSEAVEIFQRLASTNLHVPSKYFLGTCYANGWGIEKNLTEAAKWYQLAAQEGNFFAQCDLAFCYFYGIGVEKNIQLAVHNFRLAAEQNYPPAQYYLGVCYAEGFGVEKNKQEGIAWIRKAAVQKFQLAVDTLNELEQK